jgi:hypothetical protein
MTTHSGRAAKTDEMSQGRRRKAVGEPPERRRRPDRRERGDRRRSAGLFALRARRDGVDGDRRRRTRRGRGFGAWLAFWRRSTRQ